MDLEKYFYSLDINDIESFVENGEEETLYLEFKTVNHPEKNKFDRKNLSKVLSGFANSNGGIVIWGIYAKTNDKGQDVAKSLKPIDKLTSLSNYFKKIEEQCVTPTVDGVQYRKFTTSDDVGFLLMLIPASPRSPHMAEFADKYYYKRSGDSFYRCEHYDIMDMLNRKHKALIKLNPLIFSVRKTTTRGQTQHYNLEAFITIANHGYGIAKNIRLELSYNRPFIIMVHGIDGNGGKGLTPLPSKQFSNVYSGGQNIVVHANSELEVDKIELSNFYVSSHITHDLELSYNLYAENADTQSGVILIRKEKLRQQFDDFVAKTS